MTANHLKWADEKDNVFYSNLPGVNDLPDDLTIPDFMFNHRKHDRPDPSNMVYFIDPATGKETTFSDCQERTKAFSRVLDNEYNVGRDDVVLIFSPNTPEFATCCWAAHQLGGIISAANPSYLPGELAYQMTTVSNVYKVKAIVAHPLSLAVTMEACKQAGLDSSLICLIEDPTPSSHPKIPTMNSLIKKHTNAKASAPFKLNKGEAKTKLAFLSFSSGTTGLPKAVMISHYNVISNVLQYSEFRRGRYEPGVSRALAVLPFYHIYGLVIVLHAQLFAGVSLLVMPKFDLKLFLKYVAQYKVQIHCLVPPMAVLLVKSPEAKDADLSAMRDIKIGGAPLSGETMVALRARVPNCDVACGYGMTETATSVVSSPSNLEIPEFPPAAIGRILPNVAAKIMNPKGEALKQGQVGELAIFSPSNAMGYLNNKKATDDTLPNGWVHTGDEAYVDANGAVFITDRIKELIKTNGMQVAPAELEGLLLTHPDIQDACVVGIKDEMAGEKPKAFVVLSTAARVKIGQDPEQLRLKQNSIFEFMKEKTIRYKHLSGGVEFIDAIPKNPSGKLLRRVLRDRANAKAKL